MKTNRLCILFFSSILPVFSSSMMDARDASIFSRISIASENAIIAHQKKKNSVTTITYKDNVHVILANDTHIYADNFIVKFNEENRTKNTSPIQTALFKNNVYVNKELLSFYANALFIDAQKSLCILRGNVSIEQRGKNGATHTITQGDKAYINLACNHVSLMSKKCTRVTTTIQMKEMLIAHSQTS